MRGLLGTVLVLCGAAMGATAVAAHTRHHAPPPVRVVLSRDGGLVIGGGDDARARMSSSLRNQGIAAIDLQPFQGDDAQWRELVQCVRDRYAGYNVVIGDTVPRRGAYILTAIGGPPSQLQLPSSVGGLAPHNGSVINGAVAFVFQTTTTSREQLCQTTAHEIGHALGLDHTRLCSDLMSYESCGTKRFREEASRCGEWEARDCDSGHTHQNSDEILARNVGRRGSQTPNLLALAPL